MKKEYSKLVIIFFFISSLLLGNHSFGKNIERKEKSNNKYCTEFGSLLNNKKENAISFNTFFVNPSIKLDSGNITGAGGININTKGCSSGYELLDNTNTGATSTFSSPNGLVMSMVITLTNPQDGTNEQLSIGGIFAEISVAGNGTASLVITNNGSASTNAMRNVLNDLIYKDLAVNPNTAVQRQLTVKVTDITGLTSNTATAFFNVTKAANSGNATGPLYVFTTGSTVDLFLGLDGTQDAGGTWVDVDGTGSLIGSIVTIPTLPLGGSTFRYDVVAPVPCGTSSVILVVIKMDVSELVMTSPNSCGVIETQYSDPLYSANSNDPIFTNIVGTTSGQLVCPAGTGVTTYDWYKFNPVTNSYSNYALGSTASQVNLPDGGYLIVRTDLTGVKEGRAWIWNLPSGIPNAGPDISVCEGIATSLNGNVGGTTQTFNHYNPVPRPLKITNTTKISVKFSATHTYVSDLAFYFINPAGTKTIILGANQGNVCNSGNNVNNLTFTNQTPNAYFNFCGMAVPLTGTFNGYFTGPLGETPANTNKLINWGPLIGEDANSGGWKVRIYDCVGADIGNLTSTTIIFDDGAGNVRTYTSGSISVPITDNSCTPATASTYIVPSPAAVVIPNTLTINNNVGVGGALGGYQWSYSTGGLSGPYSNFNNSTLTPSLSFNTNTWVKLALDNGLGTCLAEDTLVVTVTPSPSINTTQVATVCSGSTFTVTPTNGSGNTIPLGTTYSWSAPVVAGITGAAAGTNATAISGTLTNTTNAAIIVTYNVAPASGSCIGTSFTVTITVNPKPSITTTQASTICSGNNFVVTPTNGGGNIIPSGTTYSWSAPVVAGITGITSGTNATNITNTLNNITNASIIVPYTVTPTSGSCSGSSFVVNVTVKATPIGVAATKTVCSGRQTVNQVLTTSPFISGTTFTYATPVVTGGITGGNARSTGSTADITDILVNPTAAIQTATYTITPTTTLGCVGATFTVVVTVSPVPILTASQVQNLCSNTSGNVTASLVLTTTPSLSGAGFTWTPPVLSGGMTYTDHGFGTSTIIDDFHNPTTQPQTATYSVTPIASGPLGGCIGNDATVVITVNPNPIVTAGLVQTICSGQTTNRSLSSTNSAVVYSYPVPTISGAGGNVTGGIARLVPSALPITDLLVNTRGVIQTATYMVTALINGCPGNPVAVVITVNPSPNGVPALKTICSGQTVNQLLSTSPLVSGTTFTYAAPAVTGGITGGNARNTGSTADITDVLVNLTGVSQTATYTVTPTSSTGCVGSDFTVTITVNPSPNGVPALKTICSGQTVNQLLSTSPLVSGTTFTYAAPAVTGGITGGNARNTGSTADITDVLVNLTGVSQTATYTVTPTSSTGCVGSDFTVTITVNPSPNGVPALKTICSGQTVNQLLSTSPLVSGTTFTYAAPAVTGGITGGNARNTGSTADITDVLVNLTGVSQTATYTVTPTSSTGCVGSDFTVTITVNPSPNGVPALKTICSGQTVNQLLSTSPLVSGTTFTYAAPAVTGGITGGNARNTGSTADITDVLVNLTGVSQTATYTVTPTSSTGCVGSDFTVTITVNPSPNGVPALKTICSGQTVNQLLSTSPLVSGTTFTYAAPAVTGGITGGNARNTGSTADITDVLVNLTGVSQTATYTVTPTSSTGCVGSDFTVTITVNPSPNGVPALKTICSGQTVNQLLSTSPLVSGTTFTYAAPAVTGGITGGNARNTGSTADITDVLVNLTGVSQTATYTVTPTSSTGCVGSDFTVTITVNPSPNGVPALKTICSGQTVNQLLSTSPLVSGTTFTYAAPAVTGGITGGNARNTGSTADITDVLVNLTGVSQTATYTVTPTSSTGCVGSDFTVTITVNPSPNGVPALKTICSGQTVNQLLSTSPLVSGTTFTYAAPAVTGGITGGNARNTGSTADITDVLVNLTGVSQTATYTVTPTSSTGCVGSDFTVTITVNPSPNGVPALKTICSGQTVNQLLSTSPLVSGTTFTYAAPAVTGGITGGNARNTGSTADITDVLVNLTGVSQTATYTVTPTSSTGCVGSDFTVTITVNPSPNGVPALKTICSGQTVNQLLSTSPLVSGTTFTYAAPAVTGGITGGNARNTGSTADITDVLVNLTGVSQTATYTVTPTSSTGCVGSDFTVTITVNPSPNGVPALKTICSGQTVNQLLSTSPLVSGTTFTYAAPAVTGGITGGNARNTGSTADITDVLVNLTGVSQTATYTVTPTSSTGCVGSDFTVTITVNPSPNGVPALKTICSGQTVNQLLSTSPLVSGTTFTYAAPAVTGGITGGNARNTGSTADITDVLVNLTGVSQTATYTVTPTSSTGCVGSDFTVTITVNPSPNGVPALKTICSGQTVNQLLSTSPLVSGTTFTYAAPAVTGGITGGNARNTGSTADITDVLVNLTGVSQTATYTVTPTSSTGCVGSDFTVTITVNPSPNGVPALKTICSGQTVNQLLSTSPLVSGTTFTYAAPAVTGGITGGNARNTGSTADITDVLVNLTGVSQTATYTVTPTSSTGCVGSDFTVTITVNPSPNGVPALKTICSGQTVNQLLSTSPLVSGTTFTYAAPAVTGGITGGNARNTGSTADITDVLVNLTGVSQTATYTVTPTSSTGCVGSDFTVTITVNPSPNGVPALKTICSGQTVNQLLSTSPLVSGTTFTYAAPAVTGGITGGNARNTGSTADITDVLVNLTGVSQTATYTVTPTSSTGCVGSDFTVTITVNPSPNGVPALKTICSGQTVNQLLSTSPLVSGTTFTYAAPAVTGGITGGNARNTGSTADITDVLVNLTGVSQTATYTVTPTSSTGCVGSDFTVTITVNPSPNGVPALKTICSGQTVNQLLSTSPLVSGTTFTYAAPAVTGGITGGNARNTGSTADITDVLVNLTGVSQTATYTVTPTSSTGCVGSDFTVTITVNPSPNGVPALKTICSGQTVNQLLSTSPLVSGTTFTYAAPAVTGGITGGNARNTGSTADITDVLVNLTGVSQTATYTVTPTSSTGCVGSDFTVTITVNPSPNGVPALKTICSGQTVNQLLSTSPLVSGTTFTYAAPAVTGGITGGNARNTGSTADITDVLVNLTGVSQTATYTVTPTSSTGCVGSDFTVTITVNPSPNGVPALKTICSGQTVNQLLSTSPLVSGTTFTYAAPAVTGGITGGNARNTGSTADITDVLVNLTGVSQTATYTVTPTSSTGCVGSDFTVTITVNPSPNGVPALKTICSGQTVNQLLSTSPLVSGTTFTYAAPAVTGGITGGNARNTGSTADITDVLVNLTGVSQTATYTVTPTSSTGCVGSDFTVTITVNPSPNGVPALKTICSGQTVNQLLSTSPLVSGTTFTYAAPAVTGGITGGNARNTGSTADITDVLVNLTGVSQTATYTVTPTSSTGCVGSDFTVTITVNPSPNGVPALKTICSGQTVNQLLSTSPLVSGTTFTYAAPAVTGGITGGNARNTGSTADITDVLVNLTGVSQTATYTVTPTSSTGCVGSDFTVTITVNPSPNGVPALKTICSGQTVNQLLSTSPLVSGTTFTYAAPAVTGGITGGNARNTGSTADITDVLVNLTGVSQTATYTVTPTSSTGCVGSDFTVTITVNPMPDTATVTTLQPTCTTVTGTVTIMAPTGSGMTYSIDGSTYTNTSGIFTLVPIGAYVVTTKSIDGCISLGTNVTVNPQPATPTTPILGTLTQGICMYTLGSIVLSGLPSGNWTINQNGSYPRTYSSSGSSYLIPELVAGSYDFTVTNSVGCTSGETADVILNNILCGVTDNTLSPINGYTGGTAVANVLANDKLNDVTIIPSQVVLTLATTLPTGITFNTSTGEVGVNPGTPAGIYSFDYTICEVLNPTNCSTSTVTINVGQAPIDAINDTIAGIVGINQVVTVLNVFTNDILNGVVVNSSKVVLLQTVADSSGFMTLNSDGTVVLAPNTPAGTYTLTYKICEILNPLNCDTAVVTVSVVAPTMTIIASSLCLNNTPYISYTVTPDNFTPTNLLTVKWIDSANTVVATQTNLPLTGQLLWPGTVSDGSGKTIDWPGWLLVNGKWIQGSDGFELTRPAVTMEFSLNPTVSQMVNYPPATALCNSAPTFVIDAVNDLVTIAVNQQGAALGVINVFSNDILNTVGITASDVTITVLTSNPNLILNPNGTIDVLSNTPAGTYTLTYQICEKVNSSNCDTATVTILVQIPTMILIKTAALVGSGLVGETITYTFTVTNTGNVAINNIVINDALLSPSPIIVTSSLAIGSVFVVKVNYTITQADVDFGKVINSAIASGVDTNGTVVSIVSDNGNIIKGGDRTTVLQLDQKPSIAVIKRAVFDDNNGDGLAQAGESVTYSFKVTNTGNVPLSDVVLTDLLPGIIVIGGPINLAVGQNDPNSFKATYFITQADINRGNISNQASVAGKSPKGVVVKDLSDDSDNGSDNPTVLAIKGCMVEVFNAVSPNGDGENDMFYIGGIECYTDNTVEIYNRWGVLVFERSGYNNTDKAFKGVSEGRVTVKQDEELPAGTYYYVIKYKEFGGNVVKKAGYLYVNRK